MGALQPHTEPEAPHGGTRMHVTVAVVLAVLTLIAFGLAGTGALPNLVLIPVLLVMAVAQIALQVLYYMHLKWDSRTFAGFFIAALVLAVVIAVIGKTLAGL